MSVSTTAATPAVKGRASGLAGWIGMVMLQGSTLPTLYDALTGVAHLPPLSLTALTWAGLSLYLWNAIAQKNVLYMVGNTIGLTLNSIVLGLILIA